MKKNLRFFLFVFTVVCCLPFLGHSQGGGQGGPVQIIGPDALCEGECATYTVEYDYYGTAIIFNAWHLNGMGSITIPPTSNPFLTQCANDEYDFMITLEYMAYDSSTDDYIIQYVDKYVMSASLPEPIIVPASAQCPDSLSACEKICAFNSAVYEVTNVPADAELLWEVEGEEGFVANGNSIEVEWGAPGQGEVRAYFSNAQEQVDPLQLICGQTGVNYDNNGVPIDGDVFIEVLGGEPPYEVQLSSGTSMYSTVLLFPGVESFSGLESGQYEITVTSADGQTEECSVFISLVDQCTTIGYVWVEQAPVSCTSCNGVILTIPLSGIGLGYLYSIDGGATFSDSYAFYGVCPGNYSVVIFDTFEQCSFEFEYILPCPEMPLECTSESSVCVEILEEPSAAIASTPPLTNGEIEVCEGQAVFFENNSESAASYIWDFGDLNTSTQFEPSHVYQTPGNYQVALIARNACFCSDTTFVNVNVLPAGVPAISCTGTVCAGASVTYATDEACSQYNWIVNGGGTIQAGGGPADNFITVEWGDGPQGLVSLSVNGCAGNACNTPNVVPIPIISESAQIQGRSNVCEGSTEEYFIPNYQGTEITWSVEGSGNIVGGQGTERITVNWYGVVNQGNPQKVMVAFDNCYLGCKGMDTMDVNIVPSFYTRGPIEVCENSTTEYNSRNSITNLLVASNWEVVNSGGVVVWSTGGTNTAAIDWGFPIGTYTVRASSINANDFCNQEYDVFVEIKAAPAPVTGIDGTTAICPGESYSYMANGLPINEFNWTITGGTPADFKGNPINVTWGTTPPYEVAVTQTGTSGLACTSDAITLTIDEVPSFSVTGNDQVCIEETSTYTAPHFENVDYEWIVSPAAKGTIVSGQGTENVEVLWNGDGPANVSVTVCAATVSVDVTVSPKPAPELVYNSEICAETTTSIQTTLAYTSYQWSDETGSLVSTSPAPDLPVGYYELKVTDQVGCEGRTTFEILEWPEPVVSISTALYLGLCPGGAPATIVASSSEGVTNFAWFENGLPVGTNSPQLVVGAVGDYQVVVTDQNGCTAISNTLVISECEPAGGVCVNGVCIFPPGGSGPGNPGGGGGGSSGGNPCIPDGDFSFQIQTTDDCLTHNYLNTSINDVAGSWSWDFDDPASGLADTSTLENPTHTFSGVGYYSVVLVGEVLSTTGGTCPAGVVQTDSIEAVADFEFVTACPGIPVSFTDITETMPSATITNWEWDFGDPASGVDNTSNDQHPLHTYQTPGTYTVNLTITLAGGCTAERSKDIGIFNPPDVEFSLPTITCENTALPFSAVVSNDAIGVTWDFGDPASGDGNTASSFDTYHEFNAAGNYPVTLTAANVYGCATSVTHTMTVTPNNLYAFIQLPQPPPICEGDSLALFAVPPGLNYLWSTGSTSNMITVYSAGIFDVTVTDSEGCTASPGEEIVDVFGEPNATINAVEYNEFGQPIAFFDNSFAACEGEDVHLVMLGSLDYSYEWSDGNGGGNAISFTEDRDNLLSVGDHDFTVIVTDNATGCTSETGPFTVTVHPKPEVAIESAPSGFLCENNPATLSVVGPSGNLNYAWNTGESGTSVNVIAGGTYFAQAVNQFGCKNRSNEITLHNAPDFDKIPSGCHTRCNPDTLCLPDLSEVASFQWFLDGLPLPAPNGTLAEPVFDQSGAYYVEMIDVYGCQSRSDVLTLDLLPGFGDVLGQVYFDVNGNGIIDGPDTLVSGISIFINDGLTNIDTVISNSGAYVFPGILSTNYTLELDTTSLPADWYAYWGVGNVEMIGCDVEESFDWLLAFQCTPETLNENYEACQGGGITYQNTFIPAGSVDTFQFLSVNDCDSVVIVAVEAIAPDTSYTPLSICADTTAEFAGAELSPGEQQVFTLTAIDGCDSLVEVTVTGWPTYAFDLPLFACENSFIEYNGQPLYPGDQQDFLFTTIHGCDSVMSVSVAPIQGDTIPEQLFACPDSVVTYEGVDLAPGDEQAFVFTAVGGCDSVVQVTVDELLTFASALPLMACENSLIEYNGQPLYPGQQQDFVLVAMNGCDSTVTVTVEAIQSDTTQEQLHACPNATVEFEGVDLAPGDQEDFIFPGSDGCDSVVQVTVGELPTFSSDLSLSACGNSFVEYNGQQLFPGDQEDFILSAINGCDSVISVTVSALPVDTTAVPLQVCAGEIIAYGGQVLSAGDQIMVNLTNQSGCDSILAVSVAQFPAVTFDLVANEICWDGTNGQIIVQNVQGGATPYQVSLNGGAFQPTFNFENLGTGAYTVYLTDGNDCEFADSTEINALPPMVVETMDESIICGEEVELSPVVSSSLPVSWQWTDGTTGSSLFIDSPGTYYFNVSNECETVYDSIAVSLEGNGLNGQIFMPNSFSPNNDGINDCYRGYVAPDLEIESYELKIFDRWGNFMFETTNIDGCWDGRHQGEQMQPAVFAWFIKLKVRNCDGQVLDVFREGDIHLIR